MKNLPKQMFITSLFLTIIVLISCTVMLPKVNAVTWINLESRESNDSSINKGTITLAGTIYSLPKGLEDPGTATIQIAYTPSYGFRFVKWESEGAVSFDNPNLQTTTVDIQQETGEVTIRAVYEFAPPVGGIVVPTNTLSILTPYLALAGLAAVVSAAIVVKRRRD